MNRPIAILIALSLILVGCKKDSDLLYEGPFDNVMIFYSAGFNNLSGSLRTDINDVVKGTYLPAASEKDAILVFGHHTNGAYSKPTRPCVVRLYTKNGIAQRDTVYRMAEGVNITTADALRKGLDFIAGKYPAQHYGMVMSSHGTGWIPKGYYDTGGYSKTSIMSAGGSGNVWINERVEAENPLTKSFGAEVIYSSSGNSTDELSLEELARCIPMHLDYLLFDACLMGCIETAYELRKNTDYMGFSQAEVLTEGFVYNTMAYNLLVKHDPSAVCKEYYEFYANQPVGSSLGPNATIAYVNCNKLDNLASICKTLFGKYRTEISALKGENVQRYFRKAYNANLHRFIEHSWYYDLEDILIQCGASKDDLDKLSAALSDCVVYKAATPSFLKNSYGFDITHFCGFSMYLPSMGDKTLDTFYKSLEWNRATGLVE